MKLNLPFQGNYPITQTFGELYTDPTGHKGIDYALPAGTVVRSAGMGKIIQTAEEAHGYGRFILIDHGEGLQTIYAHLSEIVISVGQSVEAGQIIGFSGNSGNSTGPHLHFELRLNGKAVDPQPYLTQDGGDWVVCCEMLNVRTGPGIGYPVCGGLVYGTGVKELSKSETLWVEIAPGQWAAAFFEGEKLMDKR